jgi:hypothetical protein
MVLPVYRPLANTHEKIGSIRRIPIRGSFSGVVTTGVLAERRIGGRSMKPLRLLNLPALLLGLGALVFFTPACRAQSEVSPDHFDGTDSWQTAAQKPMTQRTKQAPGDGSYLAQNKKVGLSAALQLAAVRDGSKVTRHNAVAVQDKRRTAVRKSNQNK